jgi:L-alanine-DL-glutamate epimerase-like enolase superfamily enzyme
MTRRVSRAPIHSVGVRVFEIPTDAPESDGTLEWNSTTLVLVSVEAGGETGIGYTYADRAAAVLIEGKLAAIVEDRDALAIEACWMAMLPAVRNLVSPASPQWRSPGSRLGRCGDYHGGICLRTLDLPRHSRGRGGGRTPGRCDAMHGVTGFMKAAALAEADEVPLSSHCAPSIRRVFDD